MEGSRAAGYQLSTFTCRFVPTAIIRSVRDTCVKADKPWIEDFASLEQIYLCGPHQSIYNSIKIFYRSLLVNQPRSYINPLRISVLLSPEKSTKQQTMFPGMPTEANRGPNLLIAEWLTVALALITVGLRVHGRCISLNIPGWDDHTILAATVGLIETVCIRSRF